MDTSVTASFRQYAYRSNKEFRDSRWWGGATDSLYTSDGRPIGKSFSSRTLQNSFLAECAYSVRVDERIWHLGLSARCAKVVADWAN